MLESSKGRILVKMKCKKVVSLFLSLLLIFPISWSQGAKDQKINPSAIEIDQSVANKKKIVSQIKLVSPFTSISPQTKKIPIGLWIQLDEGWHSYWKYPGESGKAPSIEWYLEKNIKASNFQWPKPERLKFGSLINFGYKNQVLLISELSLSNRKTNSPIKISADVEWLVCENLCIPLQETVHLFIDSQETEKKNKYWAKIFDEWKETLPTTLKVLSQKLKSQGDKWKLHLNSPEALQLVDVFPLSNKTFSLQTPKITSTNNTEHIALIQKSKRQEKEEPIQILASFKQKDGKIKSYHLDVEKQDPGLLWFLLFAFLGGILLNFMPCVLPIVFLKFSNTLEQLKKSPIDAVVSNIMYSLGVISSFLVLAMVLIALRRGGELIGWGFQMQSPHFLLSIIFLFTLISLNFMGWFSISFQAIPFLHSGSNHFKHFLTGILSSVAASPCTAPFMGAASGYAITSGSTFNILSVFSFMGLGLASPYLLLSIFPVWMKKYFPTPGAWSDKFKHFMALPMLATTAWLVHLLNQQSTQYLLPTLLSLLAMATGFWLFNNIKRKQPWTSIAQLLILVSIIYPFSYFSPEKPDSKKTSILWEDFSIQKMNQIHEKGEALFVNFTADWCLTCKFNERITFRNQKVSQFFKDQKIHALKGDWTKKSPEITSVLNRYGRSGIPFYLYFPPDPLSEPVLLPEILTPHLFFKYIKKKTGESSTK